MQVRHVSRELIRLSAPIGLALLGCIGIYSTPPETGLWKKQLLYVLPCAVVAGLVAFADYRKIILGWSPFLYSHGCPSIREFVPVADGILLLTYAN